MIAALWANTNYDEEKGAHRHTAIEEIEANFKRAVKMVHAGTVEEADEGTEIDWNDPFFAAAARGLMKQMKNRPSAAVADGLLVKDHIDVKDIEIDQ